MTDPTIEVRRTTETGPTPALRPFQELPHPAPAVTPPRPLVSPALATVLVGLAHVLGLTAGLLAPPASWIVAALALLAAVAAGVGGVQVPQFAVGRPLVTASIVAPLTALVAFLADYTASMPPSVERGVLMTLGVLAAGVAGIPFKGPRR